MQLLCTFETLICSNINDNNILLQIVPLSDPDEGPKRKYSKVYDTARATGFVCFNTWSYLLFFHVSGLFKTCIGACRCLFRNTCSSDRLFRLKVSLWKASCSGLLWFSLSCRAEITPPQQLMQRGRLVQADVVERWESRGSVCVLEKWTVPQWRSLRSSCSVGWAHMFSYSGPGLS